MYDNQDFKVCFNLHFMYCYYNRCGDACPIVFINSEIKKGVNPVNAPNHLF
jgi:hypothetical protein